MPNVVARVISLVVVLFALVESACDDKPTKVEYYDPFPQQLFDVSADSDYVYFRDDGTAFGRPAGIYRVPIEGGALVEPVIIHPGVRHPNVRADGSILAFIATFQAVLLRDISADSEWVVFEEDVVGFDWYGDDTLVCEIFDGGLFLIDLDSAEATQIDDLEGSYPTASHLTERLAFFRYRPDFDGDTSMVYASELLGQSVTRILTLPNEPNLTHMDWSPNGSAIAIERNRQAVPRVAVLRQPELTVDDSLAVYAASPRFTTDGRIVYVHLGNKLREENDEIWIMDADGGNRRKIL